MSTDVSSAYPFIPIHWYHCMECCWAFYFSFWFAYSIVVLIRNVCLVVLKGSPVEMYSIHITHTSIARRSRNSPSNLFKCYQEYALECEYFFFKVEYISIRLQTILENLPRYPYGAHTKHHQFMQFCQKTTENCSQISFVTQITTNVAG